MVLEAAMKVLMSVRELDIGPETENMDSCPQSEFASP
jgi:hypothetical protein